MEGPEWNYTALTKARAAHDLQNRLQRFAPGALPLRSGGRYPVNRRDVGPRHLLAQGRQTGAAPRDSNERGSAVRGFDARAGAARGLAAHSDSSREMREARQLINDTPGGLDSRPNS